MTLNRFQVYEQAVHHVDGIGKSYVIYDNSKDRLIGKVTISEYEFYCQPSIVRVKLESFIDEYLASEEIFEGKRNIAL